MPTIPTGKMERELRRLYMQWVHQLPKHERDLHSYVAKFQKQSMELIERMGGEVARLGALADFPAPKRLDLSLHVGTIYSDMELAAISAQIGTGLNPTDTARALVRSGVDKSYRRLERLARTETVRAYWKNAWDSIEGLGLVMVWGAENGPRTCEWCKERDGLVMDSPSLRDHPNGRCTPLPTHHSQVEYRGSIRADGRIYQDPAWANDKASKGNKAYTQGSDITDELSLSSALAEYGQTNSHNGASHLNRVFEAQGWNKPVEVVPDEVFTDLPGDSLYRGLSSFGGNSAKELSEQFLSESSPWVGTGISGNGWYFGVKNTVVNNYSSSGGHFIEVKLRGDAKVIDYEELLKLQRGIDITPDTAIFHMDSSFLAAALGYDAVKVPSPRAGEFYHIVLNRTALIARSLS